jgi:methyl farnesoate epoxidase/farnesoate epoxidase
VSTEGEHWEQLRRFTLRQLRDFGFGKNSMEESIMMEVNEFIELLKEGDGKPVSDVKERLLFAVVNSIWAIVTGHRHKQNDKALLKMTRKANEYEYLFNILLTNASNFWCLTVDRIGYFLTLQFF